MYRRAHSGRLAADVWDSDFACPVEKNSFESGSFTGMSRKRQRGREGRGKEGLMLSCITLLFRLIERVLRLFVVEKPNGWHLKPVSWLQTPYCRKHTNDPTNLIHKQ